MESPVSSGSTDAATITRDSMNNQSTPERLTSEMPHTTAYGIPSASFLCLLEPNPIDYSSLKSRDDHTSSCQTQQNEHLPDVKWSCLNSSNRNAVMRNATLVSRETKPEPLSHPPCQLVAVPMPLALPVASHLKNSDSSGNDMTFYPTSAITWGSPAATGMLVPSLMLPHNTITPLSVSHNDSAHCKVSTDNLFNDWCLVDRKESSLSQESVTNINVNNSRGVLRDEKHDENIHKPPPKKKRTTKRNLSGCACVNSISFSSTESSLRDAIVPALSPYNIFFRYERERLLESAKHVSDSKSLEEVAAEISNDDWLSEERKLDFLHRHWYRDRSVRRRHHKTHETVGFANLSRVIGKRWRNLSGDGMAFFQELATLDAKRYEEQMRMRQLKIKAASTLSRFHTSPK